MSRSGVDTVLPAHAGSVRDCCVSAWQFATPIRPNLESPAVTPGQRDSGHPIDSTIHRVPETA